MAVVKLDEKEVNSLFEISKNQAETVIGLYKMVYPDFDEIKSINGFPKTNKSTGIKLMQMCIDFDKRVHPTVLNGGLWMNNGFGTEEKSELADWEVKLDSVEK